MCQSGCVLEQLDGMLAEKGLMMPLDLGAKGRYVSKTTVKIICLKSNSYFGLMLIQRWLLFCVQSRSFRTWVPGLYISVGLSGWSLREIPLYFVCGNVAPTIIIIIKKL